MATYNHLPVYKVSGMMTHYNTYKLRKKMVLQYLLPNFERYIYASVDYSKIIIKKLK